MRFASLEYSWEPNVHLLLAVTLVGDRQGKDPLPPKKASLLGLHNHTEGQLFLLVVRQSS